MRRETRQFEFAGSLRSNGATWVEIAGLLRARWPDLTPLAAIRIAHCWSRQHAADRWRDNWPDEARSAKDIGRWETWPSGGRHPSPDNLDKLAELYECAIADLLTHVSDYRYLDASWHGSSLGSGMPPDHPVTNTVGSTWTRVASLAEAAGMIAFDDGERELAVRCFGIALICTERLLAEPGTPADNGEDHTGRGAKAEAAGLRAERLRRLAARVDDRRR